MKLFYVFLITLFTLNAHSESSIGYSYGSAKYSPKGAAGYSFGVHQFSIFDTTGGLTAGIRGGLNQSASKAVAEAKAQENKGEAFFTQYNYSWNQPAPVPTDGELWTLLLGSQGNPIIDPIAPSTTDGNSLYSVLGIEYTSILWKKEMAPISFSVTWGFKGYLHTHGRDSKMTMSVPVELSGSSLLYEKLIGYFSVAAGPYGYLAGKAKYNHIELGLKYALSDDFLANFSTRSMTDEYLKSDKINSMNNSLTSLGIQYQF